MVGPPGSGKSMMAKRLPSILPPLSLAESLETTKIHSVAGKLGKNDSLVAIRPFRSPHHTISQTAMVGGGSNPQPGEISLAHNGILYADELPETNLIISALLKTFGKEFKLILPERRKGGKNRIGNLRHSQHCNQYS